MKIHNNLPVNGQSTQKTKRNRSDGVFKNLFDAEMTEVQPVSNPQQEAPQGNPEQTWQALHESVSLLDQAMQCLEAGSPPSPQLMVDIEQLRSQLRSKLGSDTPTSDLKQADTLLAVEAERIRSLQS